MEFGRNRMRRFQEKPKRDTIWGPENPKTPKISEPRVFRKIGLSHFFPFIVPNHCAKFQKHS